MLAGIIEGPEKYSPFKNLDGAKTEAGKGALKDGRVRLHHGGSRQNTRGCEPLVLSTETPNKYNFVAPYFTSYVIHELIDKYGEYMVYNGGLRVYTTVDLTKQKVAEDVVKEIRPGRRRHI